MFQNFVLSLIRHQGTRNILHTCQKKSNGLRNLLCQTRVQPDVRSVLGTIRTSPIQATIPVGTTLQVVEKNILSTSWIPLQNACKLSVQVSNFHTDSVKFNEKSLALVHVLKEIKASPAPALVLGLAGLIPFVTVPCYFLYGGAFVNHLAFAQMAYGASILSFLGGVRWGFTLPASVSHELTWRNLGWSVTPSLLAWSSLLMPYSFGTLTLIAGIGGAAYLDLMYQAYPTWFKGLRFCLSLIAALSMWTTLVLSFILKEQ